MKRVFLVLVLGVLLVGVFVSGMNRVNVIEGKSLSLDNGQCELINLRFDDGEEEVLNIEGVDLSVKYLGAKKIENMRDYEDYSSIHF